jgi:ubiquinol-cytochrome c reductase cytochrome c subunit
VTLRPAAGGPDLRAVGGWAAVLAVVAIIAISGPLPALAGVVRPHATGSHQSVGGASAAVTEAGSALFQSQCASCHGLQGQGTAYGPSLVGAGAAGADFYLRTGRMPLSAPGQPVVRRQPVLTEEQIQELVGVVASLGDGPEIPKVTSGGDVSDGSRLYLANCAACHGATGAGNAIGGGNLAANLHQATPTQIVEAMRIGPGAMPKFALTEDQEASIASYVQFLQHEPSPGGLEIGGLGAVAEGFVAIGIGLVLFVLATLFVGRRSHEGEPPEDPQP